MQKHELIICDGVARVVKVQHERFHPLQPFVRPAVDLPRRGLRFVDVANPPVDGMEGVKMTDQGVCRESPRQIGYHALDYIRSIVAVSIAVAAAVRIAGAAAIVVVPVAVSSSAHLYADSHPIFDTTARHIAHFLKQLILGHVREMHKEVTLIEEEVSLHEYQYVMSIFKNVRDAISYSQPMHLDISAAPIPYYKKDSSSG